MKKAIALLLVSMMIFGLASCGPKTPAASSNPPGPSAAPEQTPAPSVPAETPMPSQPAAPESSTPTDDPGSQVWLYSTMDQAVLDALTAGFCAKYPDIELSVVTGSVDILTGRLRSEAGQPQADLMWGGLSSSDGAAYADLFESWVSTHTSENVTGYASFNGMYSITHLSPVVFVVNEDLEDQYGLIIESYEDLMDPALWGMVAIADPNRFPSGWSNLANIFAVYGSNPQDTWRYIEVLMPNLSVLGSSSAVCKDTQKGDYLVGLTSEEEALELIGSGVSNIRLQYPLNGTSACAFGAALVKNAPNPAGAKLLLDYLCSAEGQTLLAAAGQKTLRYANANCQYPSGSPLNPAGQIKWLPRDNDYLSANIDSILDHWNSLWSKVGG